MGAGMRNAGTIAMRAGVAGLCAMAMLAGACASFEYKPRERVSARAGGVEIEVMHIEAPGGVVRYQVELHAPPGTALRMATLEVRARQDEKCDAKSDLRWIRVDEREV